VVVVGLGGLDLNRAVACERVSGVKTGGDGVEGPAVVGLFRSGREGLGEREDLRK